MPTVSAGTKVEVSISLPVTLDQAGFEALAYTQVKGIRIVGDITKQYAKGEYQSLDMPFPVQRRYGFEAGSILIEMIRINDAGQSIMKSAIDGGSYSYRITEPDGAKHYFTATAISRASGTGDPKALSDRKMTLAFDCQPIEA